MEAVVLFFSLAIGAAIYFLPGLIAQHNKHPQQTPIVLLNLFLGWTLVGWVAALVWATSKTSAPTATCPFCAEAIQPKAIRCKHCGSDLSLPA